MLQTAGKLLRIAADGEYSALWCRNWGLRKDMNQFHVLPADIDVTGWLWVATGGRKWHTCCCTVLQYKQKKQAGGAKGIQQ